MDHTLHRLSDAPACFITNNSILVGKDEEPLRPLEICYALEKVSGKGTIEGVQKMNGLWRCYPMTKKAYNDLTVKGISLRGQTIQVLRKNPMLLTNDDGKPTTRLTIGNVFLSTATSEIENALDKIGVVRRSPIRYECLRDKNGGLTSFKSGRRFVFVDIPPTPLPSYTLLGKRKMFMFHQEQTARGNNPVEVDGSAEAASTPKEAERVPLSIIRNGKDDITESEEIVQEADVSNKNDANEVSSQIPVATNERPPSNIDEFLSRRARSSSVGRKSSPARSTSRTKRGRTSDSLEQKEKAARIERDRKSMDRIVDWFTNPEDKTPKG